MKHWKSGFFLIDQRTIPDAIVWRHPDAAIDDPRPAAGSFSMADVRRLSAHVIKLRDMPEGVLVLSGLSRVWKSRVCDLVLRGADGNVIGIHDFLCLPEWTGAEVQEEPHLDIRPTLQRFPFYCTPPAVANAVIPNPTLEDLAVGTPNAKILSKAEASQKRKASTSGATLSHVAKRTSDDDDDACVEIPLVTPLRSAVVIPSSGEQGRSSTTPAAKGPNTRDSRGTGIMAYDAAAPSVDAIHADFFSFSAGPYYATYPQDGVVGNCEFTREKWDALYRHNFEVLTKEVFKDPAVCKTVVDQFLTPREMSHHEYVQLADSRLKGYEEKSKSKGNERNKKIKSLTKSLDNLHAEVARLSAALNQATILEAEKDEEMFMVNSFRWLAIAKGFEARLSMHRLRMSLLCVEEMLFHACVASHDKSLLDSLPFIATETDDVVELVEVGSGRASSGPNDVVVALSVSEKGDSLVPSSAAGEEATANSSEV
ncbi:hypothetical protein Tco_0610291 [Tanacetum coccineum]